MDKSAVDGVVLLTNTLGNLLTLAGHAASGRKAQLQESERRTHEAFRPTAVQG